ncbi:non-hydrolyzing UDP-N-acetylglucosamine 2-epimerase [Candidatus Hadarchaeum sp.]|uniref:non-hydrolyzing UDP-N-acetylglucosamine 2-epimerase n=1 Tax=Candidatus Hadarchaeum sp. TaxID=2883567 RepID=UPI00319DD3EF
MMRVLHVVGARPNFMKVSPIMREMAKYPQKFNQILVHTGQHYDDEMSQVFFDELDLPRPDVYLGVGSGSHAEQTAKVMLAFEPVLLEQKPDIVLVVGDVNSTLACALVCSKLGVKVAHVEAGLRSFDRTMPEEINRVLTDQIADLLFTTERSANENLLREGVAQDKIYFVGNVMIDSLLRNKERALALDILNRYDLKPRAFALLTLHRPSNVDVPDVLAGIIDALEEIQSRLPIIFPAHPRTMRRIQEFGLEGKIARMSNLRVIKPLGYLEFLNLMANARLVLTDSGGIQEETTILGIPCLTLRDNTERPVTILQGTNTLVGTDPGRIVAEAFNVLSGRAKVGRMPELWDGHASERIVGILKELA